MFAALISSKQITGLLSVPAALSLIPVIGKSAGGIQVTRRLRTENVKAVTIRGRAAKHGKRARG